MTDEKVMIRISGINQVAEKRVEVILADTGDLMWLPISQAERYGSRVFIPKWLADRYKLEETWNKKKGSR